MGVACRAVGVEEMRLQGFGEETWGKEATWKTFAQMGRNREVGGIEIDWQVVGWINLAQDRHKWGAVVNEVMNSHVP